MSTNTYKPVPLAEHASRTLAKRYREVRGYFYENGKLYEETLTKEISRDYVWTTDGVIGNRSLRKPKARKAQPEQPKI
jgi:hypothetical protein